MSEKPSNENINCQKSVKTSITVEKCIKTVKKNSKTVKNSLKRQQKQPKTHE